MNSRRHRTARALVASRAMLAFVAIELLAVASVAFALPGVAHATESSRREYSPAEIATLRSLWIGSLGAVPDDPSNAYDTDDRAAALGQKIFFDPRFSANGKLSCGSCHRPEMGWQDGKAVAVGLATTLRRSMPLAGVAYNTWFFWDGRKDSLWSQTLAPLVNPRELGLTRSEVAARIAADYRAEYEAVFGPLPLLREEAKIASTDTTRVFVNTGKAIAAFVRTIQPGPARFDRYADAVLSGRTPDGDAVLTAAELRGLDLFIGRGKCINCHAGPRLTNGEFHFSRAPQPAQNQDGGRGAAIPVVKADEFACTGPYSDARPEQCNALRFMDTDTREAMHAFKVPSLRNVAARPPYMHAGQFATLADVLRFYRDDSVGIREMGHGDLSDAELADLEAFLGTLTGPITSR